MTPNQSPTSQVRRITAEDRPVFPCWLWINGPQFREGFWLHYEHTRPVAVPYTHWHPDQPDAPTCRPDETSSGALNSGNEVATDPLGQKSPATPLVSPAASAPELLDSVAQALEAALITECDRGSVAMADMKARILTALRPLWPSTAKMEECEAELAKAKKLADDRLLWGNDVHRQFVQETTRTSELQSRLTIQFRLTTEVVNAIAHEIADSFRLPFEDKIKAWPSKQQEAWKKARGIDIPEIAAIILRPCAPAAVGEGARIPTAEDAAKFLEKKSRDHWSENGYHERDTNAPGPAAVVEYCDMLDELAAEIRALSPPRPSAERTDGERLDWLATQRCELCTAQLYDGLNHRVAVEGENSCLSPDIRAAIDSAMLSHSPARTGQPSKAL